MIFSLFIALLSGCSQKAPASNQPVIVLISIDTLRADHLSSYGYERETSPFLDSLSTAGTRFEWARSSSPWTLPAHTTMLTGQLPSTHKVVDDAVSLNENTPYLPELLKNAGFSTGGFVSTMYVSSLFGFQRGFDEFQDFSLHTERKNLSGVVEAEHVVNKALQWFSKQPAEKPVFLFLHFYDVHYAYAPPSPYDTIYDRSSNKSDLRYKNYFHYKKGKTVISDEQMTHQINQYDEEIRYVDDQIKRLATGLSGSNRPIKWVITSDHGEEFGERGSWGHAHTLYSEQLRIPLILSGDDIPTGVVSKGWAGSHDIAPTIASWAGIDSGLQADGIDLSSHYASGELPQRAFLAETTRFKTNRISLLEGNYRLEWNLKNDVSELFEVQVDPLEKNNLSLDNPEKVTHFKSRIEELLGSPWVATTEGVVSFPNAIALHNGRHATQVNVKAGDQFQVLPYDANVTVTTVENGIHHTLGPWKSVGGTYPPAESVLILQQQSLVDTVEMTDQTKALLESLGYIQEEE
jgi:arylsulfatase A-like enzyme